MFVITNSFFGVCIINIISTKSVRFAPGSGARIVFNFENSKFWKANSCTKEQVFNLKRFDLIYDIDLMLFNLLFTLDKITLLIYIWWAQWSSTQLYRPFLSFYWLCCYEFSSGTQDTPAWTWRPEWYTDTSYKTNH